MRLLIALVLLTGCQTAQSKPELMEDLCERRPELAVCQGAISPGASPGAAPVRGVIVSTGAAHVRDTEIVRIRKSVDIQDRKLGYWKALAKYLADKHNFTSWKDDPVGMPKVEAALRWKARALYLSEKYKPVMGVEISSGSK